MTSPDKRKLSHIEQVRIVYRALPLSLAASALAALVMVTVLSPVTSERYLFVWLASFGLIILFRSAVYIGYRRAKDTATPTWTWLFNSGAILAGCTWGAVSLWLFPTDSLPHQIFIAFCISGVIAASAVSLSALWQTFLLFMIPALLPLIFKLSQIPTRVNMAITIGALIFMTFMIIYARNAYHNIRQNILLRQQSLENEKAMRDSQSALEESRQMLRWVLDTIPVSVFWKDTQGVYLGCNQVFANEIGLDKPREVIGKTDAQLPGAHRKLICQCDEQSVIANKTPALHQERCMVLGEGKMRWVDCSLVPLTDIQGNAIGVLGASQDITEHKRIDELKNEFISTVSHELRTPLTSIRGAIGLLRGGKPGIDSEQFSALLSIANNNTERLQSLIDDLLDIQKIESGHTDFNPQPVRLLPFLQNLIRDNQSLAEHYGVTFVIEQADDTVRINADPQQLNQVMTNLLSNAAKFSSTGQTVELGIICNAHTGCLYVQDHGVGIPPAFHDKLFDRFSQWDASNTRKAGGTGLGLSIVKSIIERHAGRVRFDSEEGVGTRFTVELPLFTQAAVTKAVL